MTATYYDDITDDMIAARLSDVDDCAMEWTGRMPSDSERWTERAREVLPTLDVTGIRAMLQRHDLAGDDPRGEIDMAISMAAEPDGMPDNAIVTVRFRA